MSGSTEPGSARHVLSRFAPMIYGPTVLFSLGEGAVLPLLPVLAAKLGADVPTAALVAAALVVGQLCGNLPAGWLVSRFGERPTMVLAGLVATAGALGVAFAAHVGVLAASVFVIGFAAAAFGLARHAFMTTRVPLAYRARALALLGGSFRFGMFIGPFVAVALLGLFGDEHAAVWFFVVCLALLIALVAFGPDPETNIGFAADSPLARARDAEDTGEPVTGAIAVVPGVPKRAGVFRTMWTHRGVLARLGVAAATLSAARSTRQVVLPLWGVSIGLDAQTIALVVGISGAIDFALFYASGQVMDRFGRLWAALPAMVLLGGGFIALSFTHDLASSAMWFAMFAGVLGVGNGLSSGILMTLGADVAPQADPAPFLGSWRTLSDAGGAAAPLIVAGLSAAASLAIAIGVIGAICLLGAFAFLRWVPRFVPRP